MMKKEIMTRMKVKTKRTHLTSKRKMKCSKNSASFVKIQNAHITAKDSVREFSILNAERKFKKKESCQLINCPQNFKFLNFVLMKKA